MTIDYKYFVDRRIKLTSLGDGVVEVSTIFDPIQYRWETVVFGGKFDMYETTYRLEEEAIREHAEIVKMIRERG